MVGDPSHPPSICRSFSRRAALAHASLVALAWWMLSGITIATMTINTTMKKPAAISDCLGMVVSGGSHQATLSRACTPVVVSKHNEKTRLEAVPAGSREHQIGDGLQ